MQFAYNSLKCLRGKYLQVSRDYINFTLIKEMFKEVFLEVNIVKAIPLSMKNQ